MSFPSPVSVSSLSDSLNDKWDMCIYVSDDMDNIAEPAIAAAVEKQKTIDARVGKDALLIGAEGVPGGRVLVVPTGPLTRDYDDVRRIYDATNSAAKLAVAAGASAPLLLVQISADAERYQNATEVAFLGCCQGLWQPLEAREALGEENVETVAEIGVIGADDAVAKLIAIESGKRVARDLCGTEPERMAPPAFADYCVQAFEDSVVKVAVMDDAAEILHHYPLMHAVARASLNVQRHSPRVIRLEYCPEGPVTKTLMFAGKGITYDTGGADLKVGGHMAGMSRDKGGAAAVAGFMQTVASLQPKGVKVIAEIGAVRNSIGEEAYVPDEIIQSHCGVRVRVGNTDAEGRMVLADMLSHLREEAKNEVAPEIMSLATLTGHAAIAFGPYTALVENGPAISAKVGETIAANGELWADAAERSLSRREDYNFVQGRTKADDVLSSNNAPSVSTPRGHQFPMAFLAIASGLDAHGNDSDQPIPFTHIDIAGSGVEGGDWQHGKPTAAPVAALASTYLFD